MENFTDALAPIRSAFIQAQREFILNNYEAAYNEITRYEETSSALAQEQREIMRGLQIQFGYGRNLMIACQKHEGLAENKRKMIEAKRGLTMAPALYPIAQAVAYKISKRGEAAAIEYIELYALSGWKKREATISKAMQKKGLDLANLAKMELQSNPGYEFRMFLQDLAGKTANARAILCWGEIKIPHMRFICT